MSQKLDFEDNTNFKSECMRYAALIHLISNGAWLLFLQVLCIRRTLCRHVTIVTPMVILAVLSFDCFWRLVHCWYTVGTVLVDVWRFVHQWSFLLFWLSSDCFDCFWLLLTVFDDWYTVSIVKNSQNHWCTNCHRSSKTAPTVYQQCTNSVPIVKNSQKTVRTARIAIGVPIVTCLHRVRRIHKAILTTPTGLLCLHISQRGTCNQVRIK